MRAKPSEVSRARPFLIYFVVMTLGLCSEAFAAQCEITKNSWDESFGHLLLGEDTRSERARRLKPCSSAEQCTLIDEIGIEYSSDKTSTVVTKGLDLEGYAGEIPFGLDRNDNLERVTRKLFSSLGLADQPIRGTDGTMLMSGACFANSKNVLFSVFIGFNADGKMTGIGVATENEYRRVRALADELQQGR